jgi:hypothetical protein
MIKHPYRLWVVVLLLGWVFDFLFWGKSVGVNFPIYIMLCLMGGFILLVMIDQKPSPKSFWLILPLGFFALMTFARREPVTLFLAYTFTLIPMGILAVSYLGGRWTQYTLIDYLYKFLQLTDSMLTRPVSFFSDMRKEKTESGEVKTGLPILPVLRGLLIALPVVLCFASLLASADLVFNQKLTEFWGFFNFGRISELIFRLIIILFWAYIIAGAILYASERSRDEKLLGEEKPLFWRSIGTDFHVYDFTLKFF